MQENQEEAKMHYQNIGINDGPDRESENAENSEEGGEPRQPRPT